MKRIYMDYAATTPAHPEVIEAMLPYFHDMPGNPSSIHSCGQDARTAVEEAREKVAALINALPEEVVFTSSGTEADNFALKGVIYAKRSRKNHVIISSIEHPALMESVHFVESLGCEVTRLPVDSLGMVEPDTVKKALTDKTVLISVMHANNEIGTIQPVAEIASLARETGVYYHTDAVQTAGHLPINVKEMKLDMLSMSAHKLYGPKGVGALYIRSGVEIEQFMHGGAQENGRRASTENVAGIVGFGKAAEIAMREMEEENRRLTGLRDFLIEGILSRIEHTRLNGHPTRRLPNNVNVSVEYAEGEAMCVNLDLEGICVSTGSACSSENEEPSHVITAIGLSPALAHSSMRFTLGKWTTRAEVERVLEVLPRVVARLRSLSPQLKLR